MASRSALQRDVTSWERQERSLVKEYDQSLRNLQRELNNSESLLPDAGKAGYPTSSSVATTSSARSKTLTWSLGALITLVAAVTLVVALGLGVGLGLGLTLHSPPWVTPTLSPAATPTPTPSPQPTPSPSPPSVVTLFDDTFSGTAGVLLSQHTPDRPAGVLWTDTGSLPEFVLTGTNGALGNTTFQVSPTLEYGGGNATGGSFVNQGYNPDVDTLRVRCSLTLPVPSPQPAANAIIQNTSVTLRNSSSDLLTVLLFVDYGPDPPYHAWVLTVSTVLSPNPAVVFLHSGAVEEALPSTPIDMELTLDPDGHCTFASTALNFSGSGPTTPTVIPRAGQVLTNLAIESAVEEFSTSHELYTVLHSVEVAALSPGAAPRILTVS